MESACNLMSLAVWSIASINSLHVCKTRNNYSALFKCVMHSINNNNIRGWRQLTCVIKLPKRSSLRSIFLPCWVSEDIEDAYSLSDLTLVAKHRFIVSRSLISASCRPSRDSCHACPWGIIYTNWILQYSYLATLQNHQTSKVIIAFQKKSTCQNKNLLLQSKIILFLIFQYNKTTFC